MRQISEVRERLRGLFFRAREDAEMEEELRFHLEMETEKNLRAGMRPEEARRQARIAFGGTDKHKEGVRDARGFGWIPGVSLDFKLGLRMLVKHPGLTVIGGFAIAVAVAVGALAFEVIGEVLHPGIPVEEGERVVSIQYATDNPGNPERRIVHDLGEWREQLRTVENVGAFRSVEHNLATGEGPPTPVDVAEMTASGFLVTRTPPLLGRYLVPDDERAGAPPVLVIGHEAWRSRFGGDPGIVGRIVKVGREPHVIVGVMPEGYGFPVSHQFWTPLRVNSSEHGRLEGPVLYAFGRLAPGVSIKEAQAELTLVGKRAAATYPDGYERLRLRAAPYPREHLELEHPAIAMALRVLQLLVGGLLVVVAVNLAILVYARTVVRLGEIAVRTALGASRRRILTQLFLEALALAVLGALLGLGLAAGVLRWVRYQFSIVDDIPFWIELDLSAGTVIYALALATLAAAIMGVLPGLKATGSQLSSRLRELGGATGARLGRVWTALIVTQVAVAVAILPVAVFTVWRVVRAEVSEVGFPPEEFAVGTLALLSESEWPADSAWKGSPLQEAFHSRQLELARRLGAEPGVSAVAFSGGIPGVDGIDRPVEFDGGPLLSGANQRWVGLTRVDPGVFAAYGAEILAGRAFQAGDAGSTARPTIVNRTFVRQFFGDGPVLGRRFHYPLRRSNQPETPGAKEWHEIVGVVEDFPAVPIGMESMSEGVPNAYHPLAPGEIHPVVISVRFRGGIPAGFARRMQEIGAEVDPALQVSVRPLTELYGSLRSGSRFVAWGLSAVTLSVLLLSAAGIYALMSFTVARRTREIGIRTALGADARRILGGVFSAALRQLAAGVVLGTFFGGVLVFGSGIPRAGEAAGLVAAAAGVFLCVGLLAALGPARRGLRIQPMEALREG